MTMRIYTKTGDAGETGLWGGDRLPKDDIRIEAIGAVDELNAEIGRVRTISGPGNEDIDTALARIQRRLFAIGAILASPKRFPPNIDMPQEDVAWLEVQIDKHDASLPQLKNFILPGGTPLAAALHCARGVCRRAERRCITLERKEGAMHNAPCIPLLNRLSDLLFVLARVVNHRAGVPDVPWVTR